MTKAILALLVIFGVLFFINTFPQSSQARAEALQDRLFTEQEIDDGHRLAVQRKLIAWASTFVTLGFLLTLACTRRARRLADRFERWTGGRGWLTILLMGAFCFLAEGLLRFPFRVLSLENWRAWGMTEQPFADWFVDYAKGQALAAGTGAVLLLGLYLLLRRFPRFWWLPAAALGGLAAVGYAWIMPIWIDPLFNNFTPLSQYARLDEKARADLGASIQKMAGRAGVEVTEVLVTDASRRSSHTNAYFTGFGSTRRIVLYDTLLKNHTLPEVESILGHEIGHWQHNHIVLGLTLGIAAGFVGLLLLSWILRWAVNRRPFLLKSPADPAGWPLVLLLGFLASWLVMPVENTISRTFEKQADWSALELTGQPDVFIAAEQKLARNNKSNLTPNPFSVFWFATHPPTLERIDMARQWKAGR
jgi:STE24 endopeptidase